MLCSGARENRCSPSERVSLGRSTCRLSLACLQVDWIGSGNNGRAPSATLHTSPKALHVSWTQNSQQLDLHFSSLTLIFCGMFKLKPRQKLFSFFNCIFFRVLPAEPAYSVSPDGGSSTTMKCCAMASEILMKGILCKQCIHTLVVQCTETHTLYIHAHNFATLYERKM